MTKLVKKKIRFEDIAIPHRFDESVPSEKKYNQKYTKYKKNGYLRDIEVNEDNTLTDGYISYLILRNENFSGSIFVLKPEDEDNPPTYKNQPTLYIFGVHKPNGKEYVWRATSDLIDWLSFNPGDRVWINKHHYIYITRTEVLSSPPVNMRIKRINPVKYNYRRKQNEHQKTN